MPAGRPVAAWLAACEPSPPASLAERVAQHLGEVPFAGREEAARRCVQAAEGVVGRLIEASATTRGSALDLLAADALATYAFELASEQPALLPALTGEAMRRFAALAHRAPAEVPDAHGTPASRPGGDAVV
jgi:hypothetical protein